MLFCWVDWHLELLVVRSLFVNNKEGGLCFAVIKILCVVRVSVSLLSCLVSKCIVPMKSSLWLFSAEILCLFLVKILVGKNLLIHLFSTKNYF